MTIDDATGLPKLPEADLFWRVKPFAVEIWRNLPDTEWRREASYYAELDMFGRDWREEKTETEYRKETRTWFTTEKRGFRKVEVVENTDVEQVRFVRSVERKERVISIQTEKTGETTTVRGEWVSGHYGYGYAPGYRRPDRTYDPHEHVTRENLQGLCEKALKAYADSQLVGDYPPKKLETSR